MAKTNHSKNKELWQVHLERKAIGEREIGKVVRAAQVHLRIIVVQRPGVETHSLMNLYRAMAHAQIGPGQHVDVPADGAFRDREDDEQCLGPGIVLRVARMKLVVVSDDQVSPPVSCAGSRSVPRRRTLPVTDHDRCQNL